MRISIQLLLVFFTVIAAPQAHAACKAKLKTDDITDAPRNYVYCSDDKYVISELVKFECLIPQGLGRVYMHKDHVYTWDDIEEITYRVDKNEPRLVQIHKPYSNNLYFAVSSQESWWPLNGAFTETLVPEFMAGNRLVLRIGNETTSFSLKGFTRAYAQACGSELPDLDQLYVTPKNINDRSKEVLEANIASAEAHAEVVSGEDGRVADTVLRRLNRFHSQILAEEAEQERLEAEKELTELEASLSQKRKEDEVSEKLNAEDNRTKELNVAYEEAVLGPPVNHWEERSIFYDGQEYSIFIYVSIPEDKPISSQNSVEIFCPSFLEDTKHQILIRPGKPGGDTGMDFFIADTFQMVAYDNANKGKFLKTEFDTESLYKGTTPAYMSNQKELITKFVNATKMKVSFRVHREIPASIIGAMEQLALPPAPHDFDVDTSDLSDLVSAKCDL